jgi:C-terminal peptidase prc
LIAIVALVIGLLSAGCDLFGRDASPTPQRSANPLPTTLAGNFEPPAEPPTPAVGNGAPAAPTVEATPTLMRDMARLTLIDEVWSLVADDYLYPDFNGVDWEAKRPIYEQRAIAATTAKEFYAAVSAMVAELKDDHSAYLSPWDAREEDGFINGHVSYVGIGVVGPADDASQIIEYVFPNSPADKAGLKRRDRIIAVDDRLLSKDDGEESGIRGPSYTSVRLTIKSPGRQPRDVVIKRELVAGGVRASGRLLDADPTIGYLVVPSFLVSDMDKQVEAEINRLRQKALLHDQPLRGLVLDLRGNGGGWFAVIKGVMGNFMSGNAGIFYSNNSYVQGVIEVQERSSLEISQGRLYGELKSLPLVVLVDHNTESAAEIMAAALQQQGRAKVVGTRSMGNTEALFYYNLHDGSRLWLAEEAFKLSNGAGLEGKGVVPDAVVDVDWTNYSEQDDPQILKAVELIHQGAQR